MKRTLLLVGTALTALGLTLACSDQPTGTKPDALPRPNLLSSVSSGDFQQCANSDPGPACHWINSVLNATKSQYAEGEAIPERFALHGLSTAASNTHTLIFTYGFRKGNPPSHHGNYDLIVGYDVTEGANANVCFTETAPVTAFCTGNDLKAQFDGANHHSLVIPKSVFTTNATPDFQSIVDAAYDAFVAQNGANSIRFDVFGGQVLSFGNVTYTAVGSDVEAKFTVTFSANANSGGDVLLAWGGRFASSVEWGTGHGAAGQSGSPFHFKMESITDAGQTIGIGALGNNVSGNVVQILLPSLSISKTPPTQTVDAGQPFSWTVTLHNAGPGVADDAVINDVLPTIAGVTYALDGTSDATCSLTGSTLECGPKDLASGADLVAKINATTTAGQGCSTTAYRNISTGQAGGTTIVADTATVTLQCPSLSITKEPDAGDAGSNVQPGDSAHFTITVSNAGPGAATNVVITDTLPAGLTWIEDPDKTECVFDVVTVSSVNHQRIICTLVTPLAASGSFTVKVSTKIPDNFLVLPPSAAGDPIEIDGNLLDSPAGGAKDWATVGINCTSTPKVGCDLDKPTGTGDDSFGGGTSEDDAVPKVVSGSIPNNKSDLLRFYVSNERFLTTNFLYLAWERVQAPNGTTNMDFELNQSTQLSSNGVTPVRTAGDVLIKFDLSQGGTNPTLGFHRWITTGSNSQCQSNGGKVPCWGTLTALTTNVAAAINTGSVDDPINPGATRSLDALTFGEASIDLQGSGIFTSNTCVIFGRAYLKSRSSDSFTSEIKDFIAPIPVNISNCAPVILSNTAWVQADGVSPISNTGQISVTETATASADLFTAPAGERLARADASGTATIGVVTAGVMTAATDSFDAFEVDGRGEGRRAGDVRAGRGGPGLAQPLRAMLRETAAAHGPVAT